MKPIRILIVEDNPADSDLISEILLESSYRVEVNVMVNGVEAMQFLRRENQHSNAPRPDLVLLDLNLPKKDGRQVLSEMKADSGLNPIPVVVLSSSDSESDVVKSYSLGVNCFVTKPLDLKSFQSTVSAVRDFWLAHVKLPPPVGARIIA